MVPAESLQAEAIASGATATIVAQIAGLEPRPTDGYLAERRQSKNSIPVLIVLALVGLTILMMLFRHLGTMEYRRSVNHYCMSGPASRCPDYPRTPGKFSYEIDPDAPAS
ncbi:MAG: hypothetical protein EOS03_00510 [Mesorhizobium sp.]|uniref:hypothetical protein n=1 Tax=Mesorhizobium sp. TaxID=1871066 RepID=UPI000FEA62C3|nr:hypothetical protein [Mesorhizobium sp.]RWN48979.1 MAG: hypothetical protein EOS03_00510 [Mesorhizobium sp.]